jgi:hypothetical protein
MKGSDALPSPLAWSASRSHSPQRLHQRVRRPHRHVLTGTRLQRYETDMITQESEALTSPDFFVIVGL